jgi:peptidase M28-like protein
MHIRFDRPRCAVIGLAAVAGCASVATRPASSTSTAPSTTSAAITAADLRTRLYIYSDDSMLGRQAGTEGNMKATSYIAAELQKMGMQPGGERGTYFQIVPILHLAPSLTKGIIVDGKQFLPTRDYIPRTPKVFKATQAIYGGVLGAPNMIPAADAAGKLVVLSVPVGPDGKPEWNNTRLPSTARYRAASAVAIVGMEGMTRSDWGPLMEEGGDVLNDPASPPDLSSLGSGQGFMYITKGMADALLGAPIDNMNPGTLGRTVGGGMVYDSTRRIARNVIGIIPGSDPKLRGEYVAIGAHNDHIGFTHLAVDHDSLKAFNMATLPQGADSVPREMTPARMAQFRKTLDSLRAIHPARLDSVYNGADDDGSGTVAVLEIAENFQRSGVRPKRSLIFVWHTGEELGLFGSEYFTDHPTVPRDSIVAQLNMDMVGRGSASDVTGKDKDMNEIHGGPDYLQLVGSRRLSTELGDLIESVNTTESRPLKFDYRIDANGHPSNIYCRSDHANYARYGIPITFFTTGGHSDYHQLTDEPQYIQYDHMQRVVMLVHDVAVRVANLDHRVVVDKAKPDPRAPCIQ